VEDLTEWPKILLASSVALAAVTTGALLLARAGYPLPQQGTRLDQIDGLRGYLVMRI
jgi:hypothetical protein